MAYYSYTPENVEQSTPARLELIGRNNDDVKAAKARLIRAALDSFFQSLAEDPTDNLEALSSSTAELALEVTVLRQANREALPIAIVGPLLKDNDEEVVVDSRYGLALSTYDGLYFKVCASEEIDAESILGISGDLEAQKQVIDSGLNRYAYQTEPERPSRHFSYTEHMSLGYMNDSDNYQPVLTVLDIKHPVRQIAASMLAKS